ncbi:MAG TPA: AraC family transcriptional regulator [Solimonas sp.]|nr:AraC family transcriptional regulator [Solimonas sp.]
MTEPVQHSLAISQVMLNYAAAHGLDPETCLAGTGIAPAQFQDAEALITREQEMRLIENLMLALPEVPAPGLDLGMQYNVSTFGTWGFVLRTSRTLREAVERAIRYLPLSTAYCAFSTVTRDDELLICADPSAIPAQLRQFLLERDLGTSVNLIRELNFAGRSIRRLEFAGRPPPYADRIVELCRVPVQFNRRGNCIVVSLTDFLKPLPTYDERLVRLLEDQCQQLLDRRQVGGIAGRVQQQLLQGSGLLATLDDVAKALNMSTRSLRRKLDAEHTSFRAIVEDARHQLATQLLEMTDMKLDEMATQTGYSDTASFTRAFRRWQGIAPGLYRARGRS